MMNEERAEKIMETLDAPDPEAAWAEVRMCQVRKGSKLCCN